MSEKKYDAVDLLQLYSQGDHKQWNQFLTNCYMRNDLTSLKKTLYGIQVGMDNLVKQKMNNEKIVDFFLRLQRSIENTAKRIVRRMYPSPNDTVFTRKEEFLDQKRKRDKEFYQFIKDSSF